MPELLPDLGALAAACVLVLIAGGLWVAAELIRQSFGRLPVVGGWVSSNIVGALTAAAGGVLGWAGASWRFAAQLFITIGNWCWRLPFSIIGVVADAASFGVWVAHWLVPSTAATVQGYAYGLYVDALNYTTAVRDWAGGLADSAYARAAGYAYGLYLGALNYTTAVRDWAAGLAADAYTRAVAYAGQLYTAATGYTTAVRDWAAGLVSAAEQTAIAHADSLFNAAEADIGRVAAAAQADASAVAAGVIGSIYTDLEQVSAGAVAAAWPGAAGDIGALRQALGADFPDIQALLPELAGLGAAGLSGALIRSLAGTAAITRLATDCIVPNCRNLSGLGNDLASLLGDASTAALLAWVVFLVADPGGWADDMVQFAVTPANDAIAAAGHLLGVA